MCVLSFLGPVAYYTLFLKHMQYSAKHLTTALIDLIETYRQITH